MSALFDLAKLERDADQVKYEAEQLLARCRLELERVDRARGGPHEDAVTYIAQRRLAIMVRKFTRAQASLVHPDDDRHAAAQQIIAYCDEADAEAAWAHPVRLGTEAAA